MSYLTTDGVRQFIWDRTPEDNEVEMDLAFSDAEILSAMKSAAREYNSIPPLVNQVTANQLPDDTNMFFDATVMFLYLARLSKMQRNDIEYDAGGTNTAYEKKQIEHLKQMIAMHRDRFKEAAQNFKIRLNLRSAFGRIG